MTDLLDLKRAESFLKEVQTKLSHSRELSRLKGERFNIFSLLNMESAENATHSRFLAELLSPQGTHGLSHTLLAIFITRLKYGIQSEVLDRFDISTAHVAIEKSLGRRDDILKTGGRVDIAITDGNGLTIL